MGSRNRPVSSSLDVVVVVKREKPDFPTTATAEITKDTSVELGR